MFNSSTLPPNTPPTMSTSQKEQDAASSLVKLQQSFSNNNDTMQPNSGMTSPASSPTESNPPTVTTTHHIGPRQQPHGASASTSPSSQQVPYSARYELIMLPSIFRQRESAVRSTSSRSLPVFGTFARKDAEELRRESAIQNDHCLQQGQVHPPPRKQLTLPQAQYHSVNKIHHPQQASLSQSRPLQVTLAQAFAHAQAQAYYLAHARVQTYGHPQEQQHQHQQQPSSVNNQQQPKKQPQQQQSIINHHVRAVEDRGISQPWPEPNSNRSSKPVRANNLTSMQNSFSIRGNGVYTQRSILHEEQQPATLIPSCQYQAAGTASPQQQTAHQEQQRLAALHFRKAHIQAAQRNLDQQGMSRSKTPLKPVVFYRPNAIIAQPLNNQREVIQQQAYRQHQQAVHRVNQHFKQQQQQQQQQQQHQYPLQQHRQAMHQSKDASRQNRELMAQHESLPHRQSSSAYSQPQPQQEQRAITVSPSTTPETVLITEADEDEEMHDLEEDEEEDDEYVEEENDCDPDFLSASKSKRHSGYSSHYHYGSNNKKAKSVKEKPRWTAEMRESLLKAVITYKNLDDMTSFHWSRIGKQVGRSGKACKDQWRRAVLPKIQQTFDRCDQDFNTGALGASSFPASLQPQPPQQQQRNNKQ